MTREGTQYRRVIGAMDPKSFQKGPSRTFRASQDSDEETRKAAHRSYPRGGRSGVPLKRTRAQPRRRPIRDLKCDLLLVPSGDHPMIRNLVYLLS